VTDDDRKTVAFIGLGVMSRGMAANAAAGGFDAVAWNRTPRDVPPGVRSVLSVADAVSGASVVVVCVTDDQAVRDVVLGPGGVLEARPSGAVVVDCSTTAPQTAVALEAALADHGIGFVDAPVTGGAEGAAAGTLTFLCGGAERSFDKALPVLQAMGSRALRFGAAGSGQLTKAVNQVMLAGAFLGVAEGLTLAKAAGLDAAQVVDALREGAAASWVLSNRGPFMARDDYPPAGRVALHHKDLGIALAALDELGLELRGTRLVHELEGRLVDSGRADLDVSAIHLAVQETAGTSGQPDG
jgi:3-hydroxyisobutyrate dehydrogenase-like beta-hydroxyacid dehydrogenase